MASLDDADLIRRHVPELEATQVITGFDEQGNEQMEDVRNPITLRLLLSHTSGEPRVGRSGHHIGL
jgi:CubicO group peptidase (beta-lactamase class C family)